jgi:LPS-assembly lipoprotein
VSARRLVFLGALLPLLLGGCGWRLAGSERLPPALTNLVLRLPQPYDTFGRRLRVLLEDDGAHVFLHAHAAPAGAAILTIVNLTTGQRVVNVNSQGVPAVYAVTLRVLYSLNADGRTVVRPTLVRLTHPYFYQPLAPLAMAEESQRLVEHLEREAAELLVLHLLHLPPTHASEAVSPHRVRTGEAPRGGEAHGSQRAEGPRPWRDSPRAG